MVRFIEYSLKNQIKLISSNLLDDCTADSSDSSKCHFVNSITVESNSHVLPSFIYLRKRKKERKKEKDEEKNEKSENQQPSHVATLSQERERETERD